MAQEHGEMAQEHGEMAERQNCYLPYLMVIKSWRLRRISQNLFFVCPNIVPFYFHIGGFLQMPYLKQRVDQRLLAVQLAVENALADQEVLAELTLFGYDEAKLNVGKQ